MDLQALTEGLDGNPTFSTFLYRDLNPLSGQLKLRTLYNPNQAMRVVHRRLRDYLVTIRPDLSHATGALPGCSPRKNVLRHRNNRYFYLTDIVSAYQSVDIRRLAAVLVELDPRLEIAETAKFLERFSGTEEGGLATGAPACPDLYNFYAGVLLDVSLGEYCTAQGLEMTRYLDDITISSPEEGGPIGKHRRKAIRAIIHQSGFAINHAKTHVLDLARGTIEINGIGLELGGRMFLPRAYHRFLRGMMRASFSDAAISYPMIAGRMGVFWGATGKGMHLNRIERKLIRQFELTKAEYRRGGRM